MCLTFTIAILSFGDLTVVLVIMIEEFLGSPMVGNRAVRGRTAQILDTATTVLLLLFAWWIALACGRMGRMVA